MEVQENLLKDGKNRIARAFFDVYRVQADDEPPASGILAALVENPDFMIPVRHYHRQVLDRMLSDATDKNTILITYLALSGLECGRLLDCEILTDEERHAVICRLEKVLEAN